MGKEKNNFQDEAEDKEYKKGFKAGRQRGKKKVFNPKYENADDILNDGKPQRGAKKTKVMPIMLKGSNDDSWHVPNQYLADSVGRISMHLADGRPILGNYINTTTLPSDKVEITNKTSVRIPGVMVFDVFNCIGNTNTPNDAFNVGAQLMFNYMQRLTGRAPSYEQAQVGMYTLALVNAYGFYSWMTRLYGTMNSRSLESRYLPQALVAAQRGNFADLQNKMASFRTFINQYALDLGSLPLPNNVSYNQWYLHQFQTIYKDSDTEKAQLYLFNPVGFYQWVEGDEAHPITYLNFVKLPYSSDGTMTLSAMIEYAQSLIAPLLSSGDIRLIGSDILNTFGNDLFSVNPIAETYTVEPEYNEEIASVIENSKLYGINPNNIKALIEENTSINGGYIEATYGFELFDQAAWNSLNGSTPFRTDPMESLTPNAFLFNKHSAGAPEPGRLLTLTRYAGVGLQGMLQGSGGQMAGYTSVRANAYNLITSARVYYFTDNKNFVAGGVPYLTFFNVYDLQLYVTKAMNSAQNLVTSLPNVAAMWSKFDWAPSIRFLIADTAGSVPYSVTLSDVLCDIDNFAEVPIDMLKNLNDISLEGEMLPRGLGGYSPVK